MNVLPEESVFEAATLLAPRPPRARTLMVSLVVLIGSRIRGVYKTKT